MSETPQHGSGRVVVPVDGSRESVVALRCAADEARRRNAVLLAVTAWTPFGGELAERQNPCPDLCSELAERARRQLETACRSAGPLAGVPLERRVARGDLGPVLSDLAGNAGDLLVLPGRRRRLPFLPKGSHPVARYCLRHTPAPILLVPAPQRPRRDTTSLYALLAHRHGNGARAA
ncbi:universal stress protein [Streptomyces puniciscabiei]